MTRSQKGLLLAGAIFIVIVLVPMVLDVLWGGRNSSYIEELKAAGEPMTVGQLLPPAIPPSENSEGIFLRAKALLAGHTSLLRANAPSNLLMAGPGRAVVRYETSAEIGWDPRLTNSWTEVRRALALNQTALELLRQLADHPALDFHVNYEQVTAQGPDFGDFHTPDLIDSVKFLLPAVLCDLRARDTAGAMTNERAMMALGKAALSQRFVPGQYCGLAILGSAENSCWEILQSTNTTDAQLATLENEWERVEYIRNWENALAMERLDWEKMLARWRDGTAGLGPYVGVGKSAAAAMGSYNPADMPWEKARKNGEVLLWRVWWSYPDELRLLHGYQVLLTAARLAATNECFETALSRQTAGLAALQITNELAFWAFDRGTLEACASQTVRAYSKGLEMVMEAETARRMTIAAIALQRFKLARGNFPARLAELVPAYLEAVPPDPVDGKPLRYHLQADGTYLLYSVGKNSVDDGGNPDSADHDTNDLYWLRTEALDWVWPQAVTNAAPGGP